MTKNEFFGIIKLEPNYSLYLYKNVICELRRHKNFFTVNGYIYLTQDHPWYQKDYDDISIDVHGGLTFSQSDPHLDLWCIGFDTNHYGDLGGTSFLLHDEESVEGTYRNWEYVKRETENMVQQALEVMPSYKTSIDLFTKKLLLQDE
jgi:hypothetical protein